MFQPLLIIIRATQQDFSTRVKLMSALWGNLCVCARLLSRVWLLATPWTVAHQDPLSMGFSRQENWSGLLCPPSRDLRDPGTEPASTYVSCIAGRILYHQCHLGSPWGNLCFHKVVLESLYKLNSHIFADNLWVFAIFHEVSLIMSISL